MKSMFRVLAVAVSLVSLGAPGVVRAAPAAQANEGKDANGAAAETERSGPAEFTGGAPELEESERTAEADRKRDEAIELSHGPLLTLHSSVVGTGFGVVREAPSLPTWRPTSDVTTHSADIVAITPIAQR